MNTSTSAPESSSFTQLNSQNRQSAPLPVWKRVLDIVVSITAIAILSPVIIAIAILVKVVSRGPLFFKQERIGHNGSPFLCYKFRTMKVNAGTDFHQAHCATYIANDVPMAKLDNHGDSRLIAFGRIIRAAGLDELPQFINVLRGEMSVVGPRPCIPFEYEQYQAWQKERFNSMPGLTGLWQVSGKNKTTFAEMIHLDIKYTREKSVLLDATIMLKTVPTLISQVLEARSNKASEPIQANTAELETRRAVGHP